MIQKIPIRKIIPAFIAGMLLSGCGAVFHQPIEPERARLGPETPQKKELLSLPVPQEKIVAAVYKFSDQTGQYKPSELGTSWSTAVTQGATSILLRALEESGWFVPIERENLGNLLNERKIIRSSRAQYMGADENSGPLMPPLLFAGIILEGGIISYETNIVSGGLGLRYFGSGGSGQYREDRVSIYLRAVSTSNGKILKTVYTTKSILSQEVSFSVFRYVKFNTLLEAETGFSYNEPTELAITEAIEKAVTSLIYEGINDSLWVMKNAADTSTVAYQSYFNEKEMNYEVNQFGEKLDKERRGWFGIGAEIGTEQYNGDLSSGVFRPFYGLNLDFYCKPHMAFNLKLSRGELNSENDHESTVNQAELNVKYMLLPDQRFSPYGYIGGGIIHLDTLKLVSGEPSQYDTKFFGKTQVGFGMEFFLINKLALNVSVDYNYIWSDKIDGIVAGKYDDYYFGGFIGLKYYFGKSPYYFKK